jgi:hypothetical protein
MEPELLSERAERERQEQDTETFGPRYGPSPLAAAYAAWRLQQYVQDVFDRPESLRSE